MNSENESMVRKSPPIIENTGLVVRVAACMQCAHSLQYPTMVANGDGYLKRLLCLEFITALEDNMKEPSGGVGGEDSESYFHLAVTGQLESAYFPMGPDSGSLFCRYDVVAGSDWELVSGMRSGITQSAKPEGDYRTVVFNMPLEFTMKSTNPHGWPQIVFSMYGNNLWNVETNRGYARIHCPLSGMKRIVRAPLYVPKFSSIWSAAMSWLTGVNPEMRDPKILADGSKHKGLASESYGELVVGLQAISRGCSKMALDWGQSYD